MAEQLLHRTNIIAVFQKVGGKTVAEGMTIHSFGNPGLGCRLFYCFL